MLMLPNLAVLSLLEFTFLLLPCCLFVNKLFCVSYLQLLVDRGASSVCLHDEVSMNYLHTLYTGNLKRSLSALVDLPTVFSFVGVGQ